MYDQGMQERAARPAGAPGAGEPPIPAGAPVAAFAPAPPASAPITLTLPRLLRLLARRAAYGLVLLGRLLRPRLGWLIAVSVLVGIIGLQALLMISPLLRPPTEDTRVALVPQSDAVLSFLDGQRNYDGNMMWDALSPDLQSALQERGVQKEALAAQAESERLAGDRYGEVAYVGGVDLDSNRRMYFYTVAIESANPERNGTFPMIFTVGRDGKIIGLSR